MDLQQVTQAVRGATSESLVILDEFGKGTCEVDGIAILCAVCEEFMHRNEASPALIVSTHFHEIARRRLLPQSPYTEYKIMQTLVNDDGNMVAHLPFNQLAPSMKVAAQRNNIAHTHHLGLPVPNPRRDRHYLVGKVHRVGCRPSLLPS